ncbi:hypothetical protein PUR71_18980 [Streptomyces sp. SP17BM10]|uniref:hypothetical protein n=1 Tax=Streptomyces sp. SP17BM10 TaxID=3002530 RepID=UPI002E79312F|nr:hypothetical protein [Streptomyces sp. SP17BM10]MEE1784977.1 hypothetical protein [Streptomyces sp. SP17BM10]
MTVSAPSSPRPGRAAATGRPAGVLWILLLVGLLTALPCSGRATAADQGRSTPSAVTAATTVTTVTVTSSAPTATTGPAAGRAARAADHLHVDGPRHWAWCSADGRPPQRDNGCSSHPYCGQDAQLPNPPPHPQPVVSPHAPAPEALPRVAPAGLLVGPHPAPDLHELQVHRS